MILGLFTSIVLWEVVTEFIVPFEAISLITAEHFLGWWIFRALSFDREVIRDLSPGWMVLRDLSSGWGVLKNLFLG